MEPRSYRSSHQGKGDDYHQIFENKPHTAMLWRLERRVLDEIMASYFPAPPRHLDFACGTGRVLGHLSDRTGACFGVDISESMLEVARRNTPRAELVHGDLTGDPDLVKGPFELITTFRFFPNAEPELRSAVMAQLRRLLDPDGYLVFNNHLVASSAKRRMLRLKPRSTPLHSMATAEVHALVHEHDLEIVEEFGLGALPLSNRFFPPPRGLFTELEWALARLDIAGGLADDRLYVCRPR